MTAAAVPGVRLWQETTAHEWRLPGLGTPARARLAAGAEKYALQRYEWRAGEVSSMPLASVAADPKIDRTRARILGLAVEAGWRGLGAGGAAGLAALVLLAGWRHSIYRGASEIADLVAGVRARGGRCIVLDRTGEYTRRLFAPARDVPLNPLDARAAAWSPLCDGRGSGDFEAMAAAPVPDRGGRRRGGCGAGGVAAIAVNPGVPGRGDVRHA